MDKNKKYKDLFWGLLFDGIGMLSFIFPGIGEFSDMLWAPMAGWLMTKMYKGRAGKVAGVIAFVEELLPGIDLVPSFTLMWIYTYVFKGLEKEKSQ